MKKALKIFAGVSAVFFALVALLCWLVFRPLPPVAPIELDSYTPSPEFKRAFDALHVNSAQASEKPVAGPEPVLKGDSVPPVPASVPPVPASVPPIPAPESGFDVENTFRAMRAMELAQTRSGDWTEFLSLLAAQDFSGVPAEVLEAQAKLLPILERIHDVEDELGEHTGSMAVLNALGKGVTTAIDSVDATTLASFALGAIPLGALRVQHVLASGYTAALEGYKASGAKRREVARQLKEVQRAYIRYLAGYMPIRRKYEREWDALCLQKDKAYLQFSKGDWEGVAETARLVHENYPHDRESVLLRALSLSRIALNDANSAAKSASPGTDGVMSDIEPAERSATANPDDPRIVEAGRLVDSYLNRHPGSSAPALVVRGLVECTTGDVRRAMTSLDQASIEYPREAKRLADMFEAYASRPYLEKTAEGQRLLRMHRSLCEGFGAFSPNLEKAFVHEREHDYRRAREEIFNHFFRRSNQEAIHELFGDMDFCERNLSVGFKGLLLEHAYFDVDYSQVRNVKTLGMTKKEGMIEVSLANRADFELKNVRLFLCVRFTEMYTGEFDVVRVGTIGVLKPGERFEFDPVELGRRGKTFKDIADVRAIVLTDDKICWVDTVRGKRSHAVNVLVGADRIDLPFTPAEYLSAFGTDSAKLAAMAGEAPVVFESKLWPKSDVLEISLPRIFTVLDPVFTIGEIGTDECVYPEDNRVSGGKIVLRFPVKLKDGAGCDLCVYSDYESFRITLKRDGKAVAVDGVSRIDSIN